MAASRSSSGVLRPTPISRSSSPTVAASSGPIVVRISIRRLLPSVRSGTLCSNVCSITGTQESSASAESVDSEGERGQEGGGRPGAGGQPPVVGPRPGRRGPGRPGRRGRPDPGQTSQGQRLGDGRAVAPDGPGRAGEEGRPPRPAGPGSAAAGGRGPAGRAP